MARKHLCTLAHLQVQPAHQRQAEKCFPHPYRHQRITAFSRFEPNRTQRILAEPRLAGRARLPEPDLYRLLWALRQALGSVARVFASGTLSGVASCFRAAVKAPSAPARWLD